MDSYTPLNPSNSNNVPGIGYHTVSPQAYLQIATQFPLSSATLHRLKNGIPMFSQAYRADRSYLHPPAKSVDASHPDDLQNADPL